jgi:hypothetical protein
MGRNPIEQTRGPANGRGERMTRRANARLLRREAVKAADRQRRPSGGFMPPEAGAPPGDCPDAAHSGMLSCFFHGLLSRFWRSDANARATRRRVECGMITSSTKPRSAATKGLAKRSS